MPLPFYAAPQKPDAALKPGRLRRRLALAAAVALAGALGPALASVTPAAAIEPNLARLLIGMGALKGLLALGAFALVWLRLAGPASLALTSAYVGSVALLFAGASLVASLTALPAASVLFHAGLLAFALTALRDGGAPLRRSA